MSRNNALESGARLIQFAQLREQKERHDKRKQIDEFLEQCDTSEKFQIALELLNMISETSLKRDNLFDRGINAQEVGKSKGGSKRQYKNFYEHENELSAYSNSINSKEMEIIDMLMSIYRKQLNFLLTSVLLIIVSLIGIIIFITSGYYIIHPTLYFITILMGTGWGLTALTSMRFNKVNKHEK